MFKPLGKRESSMRQQSVVGEVDAQRTENDVADEDERYACPTEEPGKERKQTQQMENDERSQVQPEEIARKGRRPIEPRPLVF